MYWQIGQLINSELLNEQRAEYGDQLIQSLAASLTNQYGRGFNKRSLFRMVRFAKQFPDKQIVSALSTQLSWSHFIELNGFEEDDLLRLQFYTQMCQLEHWSTRELRKKIDGQLYERTAISKQPEEVIKHELKQLRDKK